MTTTTGIIAWAGSHQILAATTLAITAALTAATVYATIRIARAMRGRATHILTLAVALIAFGLALDGMWRFLAHELDMSGWRLWAFVGVLDGAALAFAVLARRSRLKHPDKLALDSVMVWIIAAVSGTLSATEATGWGSVARLVPPLLAALLADRLLHADVRGMDRATVATVSGRAAAALGRAWDSLMRVLARAGLVRPKDQTIRTITAERWGAKVIRRYTRLEALRQLAELVADRGRVYSAFVYWRYGRADRRYKVIIAKGIACGHITSPGDLAVINERNGIIRYAADAARSVRDPWADAIDRPIDRLVIDHEPIEPDTSDHTEEPTRSISSARRSREENERRIVDAIGSLFGPDIESIARPPQRQLAAAAGVSQSTVSAYYGRKSIGETITRPDLIILQESIERTTQ